MSWPASDPSVLQEAQEALRQEGHPVVLGGNYVSGVALGRCIEAGPQAAQQLAGVLEEMRPVPFHLTVTLGRR